MEGGCPQPILYNVTSKFQSSKIRFFFHFFVAPQVLSIGHNLCTLLVILNAWLHLQHLFVVVTDGENVTVLMDLRYKLSYSLRMDLRNLHTMQHIWWILSDI